MVFVRFFTNTRVIVISLVLIAGCKRGEEVRTYPAPKETAPAPAPAENPKDPKAAAMPPHGAGLEQAQWKAPAGWQELPAASMAVARFAVSAEHPDVVLTVTPLGAEAGKLLPNVNRWEGQLGLPPSSEADLPKVVKEVKLADGPANVVDLSGPAMAAGGPKRMLGAIVPHGSQVWFLKLTGPAEVIAAQKGNFDAFVNSFRFTDQAQAPHPAISGGHPATAGAATAGVSGIKKFEMPAGWVKDEPKPMRVLSFTIADKNQQATMIVSKFSKDGFGGLLDNINRWRAQVGLNPVDSADAVKPRMEKINGDDVAMYDFLGPDNDNRKRLLVVMSHRGNDVWFFKLQGNAEVVAAQKPAFEKFLASVQFGDAGE
jgi:hypothetical protein